MARLRDDFSVQALGQGLLVALVEYASSVVVVIQGLAAVGATVGQIASALLLAGPGAHADPARRYIAGIFGGIGSVLLAALAGVAAILVARSPPVLIEALAGLALIGAFGGAMLNAVQNEDGRLPGLVTLLVTASGFSLAGIGSAFWGLVIGLAVHQVLHAGVWTP